MARGMDICSELKIQSKHVIESRTVDRRR
jgi:hypothetical protein